MSVPIRNRQSHHDPIARAHRRAGIVRATSIAVGIAVVVVGCAWVFLFSSVFAIDDIRVTGADVIGNDRVRDTVRRLLDAKALLLFQPARNIMLLDGAAVATLVRSQYDGVERVVVKKQYPHVLDVRVSERVAFGLWCRGDSCAYFDRSGARWGSAVPSHGPLLVRVQDERTDSDVPERLIVGLRGAIDALPELGLHVVSVILPDSAPGDSRLLVNKRYEILFDAYADIADQLSTLEVLLADKAKDVSWAPKYIDVRTPGRVYYGGAIDK